MRFFVVLEGRSMSSRCWRDQGFSSGGIVLCLDMAVLFLSSHSLPSVLFVTKSLLTRTWIRDHLKDLIEPNHLFKDPAFRYNNMLRYWGVKISTYEYQGYTIHLIKPDLQIVSFPHIILQQYFKLSFCLVPRKLGF